MKRKGEIESIAILGGGLSGLYLGKALNDKGIDFALFEANDCVGGLARTFKTDEFRWDLGVHALYSKDPSFLHAIKQFPIAYQECRRNVKICHAVGDKIYALKYPFENGLSDLPPDDLLECLEGYRQASAKNYKRRFNNLEDWIENGLGYGFSRVFMTPYNQKIWNARLSEISMDLVSNKIEPEPYENVLRYAQGEDSLGRAYQARFLYPKNGIQELCNHLAEFCKSKIRVGMKVVSIIESDGDFKIDFENGKEENGFTRIVSTIPLKCLIDCLAYPEISVYKNNLRHNDTIFVMIGLKSDAAFNKFANNHWSFYAGDETFYRLTMMHTFSEFFPKACVAEYTVRNPVLPDPNYIAESVVKDLLRRKILQSQSDIKAVKAHYEPFTYPIPTTNLKNVKRKITEFLDDRKIHLLGRNGSWSYINMDQVLMSADIMAMKLVSRILPTCNMPRIF